MGQKPSSTWSVIDRWPVWEGLIDAFAECTIAGLNQIPEEGSKTKKILFNILKIVIKR